MTVDAVSEAISHWSAATAVTFWGVRWPFVSSCQCLVDRCISLRNWVLVIAHKSTSSAPETSGSAGSTPMAVRCAHFQYNNSIYSIRFKYYCGVHWGFPRELIRRPSFTQGHPADSKGHSILPNGLLKPTHQSNQTERTNRYFNFY